MFKQLSNNAITGMVRLHRSELSLLPLSSSRPLGQVEERLGVSGGKIFSTF